MNILPVTNNMFAFKSNNKGTIGFDDEVSQAKRHYIREHYDSWHNPFYSIYEKEPRLNEYQLNNLIRNIRSRSQLEQVADTTIYRGQTLVNKDIDALCNLKKYNVKTVIDLVGYGETYENKVKNAGIEYYKYSIFDNWWNQKDYSNRAFIDETIKFLKKMQEGNIYIGCQNGSNDTDIALILNNFFNPLLENKCKTKMRPNEFSLELNTIFDALTQEDKLKLGWTKEFERRLIKKLISI